MLTAMQLPTQEQIDPYDCLDGKTACSHFLGKTVEQAEQLFIENSLYYQGDLMWMGPVAFRFYVPAFIRYLQIVHAESDADAVNSFHGTLRFWLEHYPTELSPIASQLAEACQYIVQNYKRFDITPDIYGDLRSKYSELRNRFSTHPTVGK